MIGGIRMVKYKLLDKQKEFMEIPHSNQLDVAMYQGGYGQAAARGFLSAAEP